MLREVVHLIFVKEGAVMAKHLKEPRVQIFTCVKQVDVSITSRLKETWSLNM